MTRIELAQNELRALECLLNVNPCSSGCAYPEMQESKKHCDKCKLTEAMYSLNEKLGLI